jgi:small subunit ribosomal protein S18
MAGTLKRKTSNDGNSGFGGSQQTQKRRLGTPTVREKTQCRFCRNNVKYIDYKDVNTLQKLLTNRGKIYSRKRSGNCAGCQRKAKKAIKRARYIALLPFTT